MTFICQIVTALAVGVVGGGYLASWGLAFLERWKRWTLGRPADPKGWVCRLCKKRIRLPNSVPVVGYLRTFGRCWECGSKIPFGLFTGEIVGILGGVVACMAWIINPSVAGNIALTLVCGILFIASLQQLSFGKVYWITLGLLLIVICTMISSVAYMLISVCVAIVYKMIYEALFEQAVKQHLIDRKDKASYDPSVVSRVDILFDLVVFNLFGLFSMIAFLFLVNVIAMCLRSLQQWIEIRGYNWLGRNAKRLDQVEAMGDLASSTEGSKDFKGCVGSDKDNSEKSQGFTSSNGILSSADKWGIKQSAPWVVYVTLAIYVIYGYTFLIQILNW